MNGYKIVLLKAILCFIGCRKVNGYAPEYVRNFVPLYSINEEAATGTSNCALTCYLHNLGIRPQRYIFEQGHNLSSVSRIIVELKTDTDILDVRVGGDGIIEGVLNKNTSILE